MKKIFFNLNFLNKIKKFLKVIFFFFIFKSQVWFFLIFFNLKYVKIFNVNFLKSFFALEKMKIYMKLSNNFELLNCKCLYLFIQILEYFKFQNLNISQEFVKNFLSTWKFSLYNLFLFHCKHFTKHNYNYQRWYL